MRGLITAGLAAVMLGATLAPSYAATCQELWIERNAYFKAGGYCFKTPRAIAYFGNAGCRYDNESAVPMLESVRQRVAQLAAQERIQSCSD